MSALVYVLPGQPKAGWVHVHVAPSESWWPNDYFAWLPEVFDERPVIELIEPVPCPTDDGLEAAAALSPPDRLRCFGGRELTFEGMAKGAVSSRGYRAEPEWFGSPDDQEHTISIGPERGPMRSMDIQLGVGLAAPPTNFMVSVTGSFDHPGAADCSRVPENPAGVKAPPGAGLPQEPPELSVLWCREQFVASSIEVTAGPEGRPAVVGDVQLHRFPAGDTSCPGVGLPMLHFRVDPMQLDAVWLESEAGTRHLAYWGPAFQYQSDPEPQIVDGAGNVVARDGFPLNPDRELVGHAVCPTGEIVYIGP